MGRTKRFPVDTDESIAERRRIVQTLLGLATGAQPVTRAEVQRHINPLLKLAQVGGEFDGERIQPCGHFSWFEPHLRAAADSANGPLLACLTLAITMLHHFEMHMPAYAASLTKRAQGGRLAAHLRASDPRFLATRYMRAIEDYERATGVKLGPNTPSSARKVAAGKIGTSPDYLLRLLKIREAKQRNPKRR